MGDWTDGLFLEKIGPLEGMFVIIFHESICLILLIKCPSRCMFYNT